MTDSTCSSSLNGICAVQTNSTKQIHRVNTVQKKNLLGRLLVTNHYHDGALWTQLYRPSLERIWSCTHWQSLATGCFSRNHCKMLLKGYPASTLTECKGVRQSVRGFQRTLAVSATLWNDLYMQRPVERPVRGWKKTHYSASHGRPMKTAAGCADLIQVEP